QPREPVTSLPIFHPREHVRRPLPLPEFASTIHGLFEKRAALDPGKVALVGDEALSYADLNARANRLAHALLAYGIGRGDIVGVVMRRSVELVAAFLAILKTGAVYLPLDPMYPAERLVFMIQDSGATLLLTQGEISTDVQSTCEVIDLAAFDTKV